jgi:beta-N-acetylglucosaminidase
VQADDKGVATQQWTFTYLGKGCFKVVSAADSSIALNAMGTEAGYRVRAAQKADSPQQSWRMVQAKSNPVTYISLGFSLSQMASWQKAGNPYINGYTTGYLKTVLNPKNGSAYKFLDLRKLTGSSASDLNTFISSYGSDGKLAGLGSAFTAAAKKYQVNEVYLLSHAILESGWGKSTLAMGYKYKGGKIDGKYYKKGTYYNFYGIGAYDSSPLSGGRKMAIINGWNTPKKAVAGAAKWITEHYIYADEYAQPTLYAMKWDLARTKAEKGYGWHQYATDPDWADSIGRLIGEGFKITKPSTVLSYIKPKYK